MSLLGEVGGKCDWLKPEGAGTGDNSSMIKWSLGKKGHYETDRQKAMNIIKMNSIVKIKIMK